jgi:hypothetical protein
MLIVDNSVGRRIMQKREQEILIPEKPDNDTTWKVIGKNG